MSFRVSFMSLRDRKYNIDECKKYQLILEKHSV
jgi:hypothetical protein